MSCNRFYKLTCYRNTEVEDPECCGSTKVGHKYLNGIAFSSGGKLIALMERPYNVSDTGQIITIRDAFGEEFTFKSSQTKYSHEELIQILNACNCCVDGQTYNIESSQVTDNGDGTYNINVVGAKDGDMAIDDLGNIYEYDGDAWRLKVDSLNYVKNTADTYTDTVKATQIITLTEAELQDIIDLITSSVEGAIYISI